MQLQMAASYGVINWTSLDVVTSDGFGRRALAQGPRPTGLGEVSGEASCNRRETYWEPWNLELNSDARWMVSTPAPYAESVSMRKILQKGLWRGPLRGRAKRGGFAGLRLQRLSAHMLVTIVH